MSQTGLTEFDNAVQKTNIWLRDLLERLGWQERHRAYFALRVVLHTLRDHLTVNEAVALGAQLPMLVRGFYFEGWHPADKPLKERKKEAFLSHIADAFRDPSVDPAQVVRAVFQVLTEHLTGGEIEGVKHCLPKEIRALWPSATQANTGTFSPILTSPRRDSMLAQFTIYPTDETHLSRDVALMMEILESAKVEYRLGPLATAVEGDWDQVMTAIRHCHDAMRQQHPRVITTITIDDRKKQPHHLDEMVSVVEKQLGRTAK